MNAPAANIVQIETNRRMVLEALAQSAAPADRVRIAKLSGLNADTVAAHLADLERAGIVERFDRGARKMSLWSLISAPAPTATDGEPGDGTPDEDHEDEETAACAEPGDFRDGDDRPTVADDPYGLDYDPRAAEAEAVAYGALVEAEAGHDSLPCDACGAEIDGEPRHFSGSVRGEETGHIHLCAACAAPLPVIEVQGGRALAVAAYDATVEAEAAADEAPLAGEDVNSDADVLGGWCADHEMAISPRPVRGDDVAMIVSADGSVSADMPALRFAPPATGGAVASGPCPTVALLIQRASPVAAEAMRRAVAAAEAEALLREKEANIALDMARDARVRGRAVAEIIRCAEQRAGLAGAADPDAVLIAIVELLDGARSAVTGMSLPA